MRKKIIYNLCVVIVCRPESLNCLGIICQCMVLVCRQIEFFALRTWVEIAFGTTSIPFGCKCCCASSVHCHFLWEFLSYICLARLLEKLLHCSCKKLGQGPKQ